VVVLVKVVEEKVVERMKAFNFQQNKAVVVLEDADVLAVQERVKCADTDANALANALEDASVLLALAAQENDSAALKDAIVVDANVNVLLELYQFSIPNNRIFIFIL
jgi:hypothetical protein